MKHSYLYLLSFIIVSLLFSCAKEEVKVNNTENDGLPEATQTGAHTLGFYLNGQLWLPSQDCERNCEALTSYYSVAGFVTGEQVPYYNIYAKRTQGVERKTEQLLEMQITRLIRKGEYFLHDEITAPLEELPSYAMLIEKSSSGDKRVYVCDSTRNSFIVTITSLDYSHINTPLPIVSGTFEGVLYNEENPKDSLTIEKGRFDLQY